MSMTRKNRFPKSGRRSEEMADAVAVDRQEAATPRRHQPEWTSERAFILSTAAAVVGLGNLWRFPYVLGENGGGAFLIAYLVSVALLAIPFASLEIAAGRVTHGGTVATFRRVKRPLAYFGLGVVLLTLVIDGYYFVLTGWTLSYAGHATVGRVPDFDAFIGGWWSVAGLGAVSLLVVGILWKGVSTLERFAKAVVPLLVVIVIGLAVNASFVGDVGKAAAFLFSFEPAALANPGVWLAALGQSCYSLAIGQGYLITYGSYLPRKVHVVRSIAIVAALNTAVALLAGWMIFPLVFADGASPTAGARLAFEVMPRAFENLPGGAIVAVLFYWSFFLAALSSCLAGAKVVIVAAREQFAFSRGKTILGVGGLIFLVGLPAALSYAPPGWTLGDRRVLDAVDAFAGSGVVVASAFLGAAFLAWSLTRARWEKVMDLTPRRATDLIVALGRHAALPLALALFVLWLLGR